MTSKLRKLGLKGNFKSIKVLKRGVSPRIVRAQIIGTRGRTLVTGPQLRTALGLRDTWATFSASGADVKAPHRASSAAAPCPTPTTTHGDDHADDTTTTTTTTPVTTTPADPGALLTAARSATASAGP